MDRVARLADIATHANVSEATVSRVLNDRPGVAASTRRSVLASLEVLGIDRPSRLRPKKHGHYGLVGLFMPELNNPIFPAFAQAIESSLAHRGFTPVLCTHTPGGIREDDHISALIDRGVAGVIYLSGDHADTTTDPQRYVRLQERGLAMVLDNGYREGKPAPYISTDDAAAE
jgi:LacI family repressor for deo operon, udp, cdd, tsx, nupC, and nupG